MHLIDTNVISEARQKVGGQSRRRRFFRMRRQMYWGRLSFRRAFWHRQPLPLAVVLTDKISRAEATSQQPEEIWRSTGEVVE